MAETTRKPDDPMRNAEFGSLVSYLARNGVANQVARSVLGNSPAGRTRKEMTDALREWLRERPKAE